MNITGASASNQTDFNLIQGSMPIEPQFETNIYLESVLPSDANMPHSFQAANQKILKPETTINGFVKLMPNPLISTNNTDPTFTPQYDYLRDQGK
jgi:hypothetical protein